MNEKQALALAAVVVGGLVMSRRAEASDTDVLEEIEVTAQRLQRDGIDAIFGSQAPLGIRNRNPMNVRETDIQWEGELPHDGDGYEDFAFAGDGIRAGARVLVNYKRRHGLDTIDGIIRRYAPEKDSNPTQAYINFVADRLGVLPSTRINVENVSTLALLAEAIIHFENGEQPYSKQFIRKHVGRAL